MDVFHQLFTQPHWRDELILAEITDITEELIKIYKSAENIADQQYIFSKLKEILLLSKEQQLENIREIAFRALIRITRVK